MSMSSIGSAGSQLCQILRESRAQPQGTATSTPGSTPAASSATSTAPASAGLSSAESKLVSDLNSLLLGLQSDGVPSSAGASVSDSGTARAASRPVGGHHNHQHHAADPSTTSSASDNPFSKLTSALSAYAQQLGLTSSSSATAASVTA